MALEFWAIGEATRVKKWVTSDSDAAGYAAALLTWALAGAVFVAVKLGNNEMPPWTYCFWRVLLSALVLLPFVASDRREMTNFLRSHWRASLFIGAIGLGLTQGMMFSALSYTSAVNVGIIFATAPIITMVMAKFFLREPMSGWQGVGSVIAFSGIVLVAVHGSLALLLGLKFEAGDFLALGASAMFSGYAILLKWAKFDLPSLPLLVILLCGGTLASLPFFLYEIWNGDHAHLAETGVLTLLFAAIPGGALMYYLFNWSINALGASRAGSMIYTQMIFVAVFAWLILGEAIEWYHFAGAGMVVAGVILVTLLRPKAAASPAR
jgi:drug/metabolite transporter (DMT)-like permease